MGTQGVQMKGVLPWLVRCVRCAGTRDVCPALAAVVAVHCLSSFVPIDQQAVGLGHLSLNVCLWAQPIVFLLLLLLLFFFFFFFFFFFLFFFYSKKGGD
jgi:hypothetical protein